MPRRSRVFSPFLLVVLALATGCGRGDVPNLPEPVDRDLPTLREEGRLTMLTTTNATSYFIYRGELMGFEFELLRRFARDQDLSLEVEVVDDRHEMLRRLLRGDGDVIASQVTATGALAEHVAFTQPLYRTRPALVQAAAPLSEADLTEPVEELLDRDPEEAVEIPARLIEEPADLAGHEVHVPDRTATLVRLVELEDRITGDIHIVEVRGEGSHEELIRQVAEGEVGLTAAPESIARLTQAYFSNLAVRPTVGPAVHVVWAVRPGATALRAALDRWLAEEEGTTHWEELVYKYFVDRRAYRERRESRYLTSSTARLSEFDPLLRRHAPEVGWDWRLLASQAFQESRFDPQARSWAGAAGLFQLMPRTAREFGVEDRYDPEDNVRGAVRYLRWLDDYWGDEIPHPDTRLRFVLASYNAGQGHVADARRLAEKHGDDPGSWEDVSFWLLQKAQRRYYTDPVVRFGFVRGLEPVTYVAHVLERYRHYRRFVER